MTIYTTQILQHGWHIVNMLDSVREEIIEQWSNLDQHNKSHGIG